MQDSNLQAPTPRRRITLRQRILGAFISTLAVAFITMFVGVNIAISQFIQTNAIEQLDHSFYTFKAIQEAGGDFLEGLVGRFTQNAVQLVTSPGWSLHLTNTFVPVSSFVIDSNFQAIFPSQPPESMHQVITLFETGRLNLATLSNQQIMYQDTTFYVSTHALPIQSEHFGRELFWVGYVDVTGLTWFAAEINRFFFWIVLATFVMTMVVSFFLALSITYPIARLSQFAQKIGDGDFTSHYFGFKDMELNHLNMVFNKSVRQLSAYDNQQKTFFQNASHELRTPLMSIKCYAEGIVYDMMDPKEASQTILSETDRLTELVSDLFYISKIDNITTYPKESLDLVAILEESAKRQQVLANKKGIRFVYEFSPESILYMGTHELVARAFDNLIANALRYANTEIRLSARRYKQHIAITVADDGKGIEPEILPQVFERFIKGADGNTGVGLSIVQTIFEQMGGSATVHNNAGAVFTLTLPL